MQNTCLQRHFHGTGRKLTVRPRLRPYSCLHYSVKRVQECQWSVTPLYHCASSSDMKQILAIQKRKEYTELHCKKKKKIQVVKYATSAV